MREPAEDSHQSFVDHLTELRKSLLWSLLYVGIGFLACWGFSELVFDIIRGPISPYLETSGGGLVFTAPMDKFLAHVKVSFLAGVILTTPGWIYQIWRFIAPGLYKQERVYGIAFIFFGSLLFLSGVLFVYFVVYPMAFEFLMTFGGGIDKPMITISDYLSFFIKTTLVFGLAFEMPVIFSVLALLGVIDYEFMHKNRRYAIVILAAISAVITPPDVVSMILMMGPMLLLYEISTLMVRILSPKATSAS